VDHILDIHEFVHDLPDPRVNYLDSLIESFHPFVHGGTSHPEPTHHHRKEHDNNNDV